MELVESQFVMTQTLALYLRFFTDEGDACPKKHWDAQGCSSWGLEKRDHQARTPDHSLRPIFLWKSARIQEQQEVQTREACPVALISFTLGQFLSWSLFFMTDITKYKDHLF